MLPRPEFVRRNFDREPDIGERWRREVRRNVGTRNPVCAVRDDSAVAIGDDENRPAPRPRDRIGTPSGEDERPGERDRCVVRDRPCSADDDDATNVDIAQCLFGDRGEVVENERVNRRVIG